jgi:hypothetical protein
MDTWRIPAISMPLWYEPLVLIKIKQSIRAIYIKDKSTDKAYKTNVTLL